MVNEPYTLQPTHIISHGELSYRIYSITKTFYNFGQRFSSYLLLLRSHHGSMVHTIISNFKTNSSGSAPQHLEPPNLRLSNATIMSEPGPALTPLIQTSSQVSGCHSNASGCHSNASGCQSRMMTNQSQSSVEAYSPFTRRRNEDPYFGLHLLNNNPQSFCYRSNPEGLCSRSSPGICDPRHLSNPGSLGPHSATPPCSYNNRRVGPMWSHGYICHGFVESLPTTPLPPLVVDTVGFIKRLQ